VYFVGHNTLGTPERREVWEKAPVMMIQFCATAYINFLMRNRHVHTEGVLETIQQKPMR